MQVVTGSPQGYPLATRVTKGVRRITSGTTRSQLYSLQFSHPVSTPPAPLPFSLQLHLRDRESSVRLFLPDFPLSFSFVSRRVFRYSQNLTFSRVSKLIPCHGMRMAKQCHLPPIKTAFTVRAREIKFWKYYGESKMNVQSRFHIGGLKCSSWWADSKYGCRIKFG